MLKNLLKISLRSIAKNRIYSALNIFGLVLGISCSLLLGLYVLDELSFDQFHQKKDRIYRVISTFIEGGKETDYPSTQIPLSTELEERYSGVEQSVRLAETGKELFVQPQNDKRFYEEGFFYADSTFFDVFDFKLIEGDLRTVLRTPFTAVVTEPIARKYFGNEDPIGKTLENKGKIFKITGIIQNAPHTSHLRFDGLLSFSSLPKESAVWGGWYPRTYLLLRDNVRPAEVEKSLEQINKEHVEPIFESFNVKVRYWLQPLNDIHLKTKFADPASRNGDISYIYIFSSIAMFIIVIAIINYINIATARAARRAKEIGVRKTMGALKGQIILQFITESTLITFAALLISIVIVVLFLPYFNQFSGKEISASLLVNPAIAMVLLMLGVFIGIAGGAYPAFYLSGFNPALVLKGILTAGTGNVTLRKILVVIQFSISIGMMVCTMVVYDQLSYLRNKQLGFDKEHVISAIMPDSLILANYPVLTNKLKADPKIVEVSTSSTVPGKDLFYSLMHVDSPEGDATRGINYLFADYGYLSTMGISVVKGRNFSRDFSDTLSVLVNESMVSRIGWDDPLGKRFTFDDGNSETIEPPYVVVGVIKDFHQQSLHNAIVPLAIFFKKSDYYVNIKMAKGDVSEALNYVTKVWNEVNQDRPFTYSFLDQDFQMQYQSDEKRGQVFSTFCIISVLISCLGLFGLSAYTTEQRAKEIGIRKVIGASVRSILYLFYKDFLKLIALSLVISFPLAYLMMADWLKTFAYQIGIHWLAFLIPSLLMLLVTWLSISYHTIKGAMANPTKSLRGE